ANAIFVCFVIFVTFVSSVFDKLSWLDGSRAFRRARQHQRDQVRQPCNDVNHAQPGHCAAEEVVRDHRPQNGRQLRKVVAIPECRPRDDDQHEADFEKEGDQQKALHWSGPMSASASLRSTSVGADACEALIAASIACRSLRQSASPCSSPRSVRTSTRCCRYCRAAAGRPCRTAMSASCHRLWS